VEHELSWVPYFLMKLDWLHNLNPPERGGHRFKNDMLPSEVFKQNVFVDFQEDPVGIETRHEIGVDNILWGSDYPHIESTFPRSHEILENILADCTDEEKAKIVGGNAARIYRI
jgi:predicted TIM-barrel fold metal-dependent hydrolase